MRMLRILFSLIPTLVFAQDSGYFGKKNVLSFNMNAAVPLVSNNFTSAKQYSYADKNGELVRSRSYLNYGFRLGLTHYFSGKFGIGMEACYDKGKINGPKNLAIIVYDPNLYYTGGGGDVGYGMLHERVDYETFSFLPKLEYNIRNASLPIGMSYEFGVGVTFSKAIGKDYLYEVNPSGNNNSYSNNDSLHQVAKDKGALLNLKPYSKSLIGLTIFYGINFKTPLSRNFLLNFGLRYTINASFSNFLPENDITMQYMKEIEGELIRKRQYSFMQAHVGVSYVF